MAEASPDAQECAVRDACLSARFRDAARKALAGLQVPLKVHPVHRCEMDTDDHPAHWAASGASVGPDGARLDAGFRWFRESAHDFLP